jgi:hypothetical protein
MGHSRLGGVMVNVLAVGSKVLGFKPDQSDRFLKAIKIRSTPSSGEEIKPEAPCRKILRHLQITFKYKQKYFARLNSSFPSSVFPDCYQMSAGRIVLDLWWMNQEFSSVDINPLRLHTHISPGG